MEAEAGEAAAAMMPPIATTVAIAMARRPWVVGTLKMLLSARTRGKARGDGTCRPARTKQLNLEGPREGKSTQRWPTRWSAPRQGYLPGRRYGCWGTPCDTICITHRGRAYGPFVHDGRAGWPIRAATGPAGLAGRSDCHSRRQGRPCRPPNPADGRPIGCGIAATRAEWRAGTGPSIGV